MKRGNKKVMAFIVIILAVLIIGAVIYFSMKSSVKLSPPSEDNEVINKETADNCPLGTNALSLECSVKYKKSSPGWLIPCKEEIEIGDKIRAWGKINKCECIFGDPNEACINKKLIEPIIFEGAEIDDENKCNIEFPETFITDFSPSRDTLIECKIEADVYCRRLCERKLIPTPEKIKKAGIITCCK